MRVYCGSQNISNLEKWLGLSRSLATPDIGYLLTTENYTGIQEEIKCRLKVGNTCYYSVQTLLSSRLLSKNLKIKIYKTII